MISTLNKSFTAEFVDGVSAILQSYFSGMYGHARDAARSLRERSETLDEWEECVARVLHEWLSTWETTAIVDELEQLVAKTPRAKDTSDLSVEESWGQIRRFYAGLLICLICSAEARDLASLQTTERIASDMVRSLQAKFWERPGVSQEFSHAIKNKFFPPPWAILWFRAKARFALGRVKAAQKDWQRAYNQALGLIPSLKPGPDEQIKLAGKDVQMDALQTLAMGAIGVFPIVGRFLHDLGSFCVRQGDWGWNPETEQLIRGGYGARAFYDAAVEITESDPATSNPYVLAGRAEFYSYARVEDTAVEDLARAYSQFEKLRGGRVIGPETFFASGRVYFQAGMIAYKYQNKDVLVLGHDRLGRFEKAVAEAARSSPEFGALVTEPDGASALFRKSGECYLSIKDPFRAMPALIMMLDPKKKSTVQSETLARNLLWDFIYGFGTDFMTELAKYDNLLGQYFIADLILRDSPSHADASDG